jgi:rare lipoprotein A
MTAQATPFSDLVLPDFGPIVPQRPDIDLPAQVPFAIATLSYADERIESATRAFAAMGKAGMTADDVAASWKRLNPGKAGGTDIAGDYIAAGAFENAAEARRVDDELAQFGKVEIQPAQLDGKTWYSVNLYQNGQAGLDAMLQAAWTHGAPDALVVRN